MKTSVKPYAELRSVGFSDSEIAQWVMRDSPSGKTEEPPANTVDPQALEPKNVGTEPPIEQLSPITENGRSSRVEPLKVATTHQIVSDLPSGQSMRVYRGYTESQIRNMSREERDRLKIAISNNEIYQVSEGENGRIVFDPVQWETQQPPEPEEDPTVKIAVRSYSSEIASITKTIAMSPRLFFSHHYTVNNGFFSGNLAEFITFCVDSTSDKGFRFKPMRALKR
jgi:hypothetical protein